MYEMSNYVQVPVLYLKTKCQLIFRSFFRSKMPKTQDNVGIT